MEATAGHSLRSHPTVLKFDIILRVVKQQSSFDRNRICYFLAMDTQSYRDRLQQVWHRLSDEIHRERGKERQLVNLLQELRNEEVGINTHKESLRIRIVEIRSLISNKSKEIEDFLRQFPDVIDPNGDKP